MKTAHSALMVFMNTAKQGVSFDLWTITLQSGTVVRWTDADVPINTFGSRASIASYVDTAGVLQYAPIDTPRYTVSGLLMEQAGSNVCTFSSAFADASWAHDSTSTVSSDVAIAPDGTTTADKMVEATTTAGHYRYKTIAQPAGAYTASFFLKMVDRRYGVVQIATDTNTKRFAVLVDLQTGTFVASQSVGTPLNTGYSIQYIGFGWYRVAAWATHTSGNVSPVMGTSDSASPTWAAYAMPSFTGDITKGVYVWGAQLEPGAIATSYIPTSAATATRSADVPITFSKGPVITRDRVRWVRGIEVDQLALELKSQNQLVDGQRLPVFATLGGFDAAQVVLERVYLNDANVVQGSLVWFPGAVTDVDPSDMGAKLVVKSQLTQLSQQLPRSLYQAGCLNNLYDTNCGVNRAALTVAGTVGAVVSQTSFYSANVAAQATGYFDLGIVKFTSGANAGIGRTAQTHVVGTLAFSRPFPFPIAPGDTFTVTPGCNKTFTTCGTKFSNTLKFRGHPFVPVPETVT